MNNRIRCITFERNTLSYIKELLSNNRFSIWNDVFDSRRCHCLSKKNLSLTPRNNSKSNSTLTRGIIRTPVSTVDSFESPSFQSRTTQFPQPLLPPSSPTKRLVNILKQLAIELCFRSVDNQGMGDYDRGSVGRNTESAK